MIPTWTDILQALAAAISIPGAVVAFVFLFKKDKDKQEQLNKLTNIAQKIEAQNEIAKEANSILNEQVLAIRNIAVKDNDSAASKRLAELKEKKLKLEQQPRFKIGPFQSHPSEFEIDLMNYGGIAVISTVESKDNSISIRYVPNSVEKDGTLKVVGNLQGRNANIDEIRFNIYYKDSLNNEYMQEVLRPKYGKLDITDPAELKTKFL